MPKNRVAFFDIDGTIRNKSLTESLFEILVRDYKYRGKDFNKYFELQSEISSLRKAYKSSEDRADDLFGEYCQKVVKFAMFALKNILSKKFVRLVVELQLNIETIRTMYFRKSL